MNDQEVNSIDDLLDASIPSVNTKANTTLNVFCILGYIGNGLLLLLFLMVALVGVTLLGDDFIEEFRASLNINNVEDALVFFSAFMGIVVLFMILAIIGLIFAHQKKTWGFILYAVVNGLWGGSILYGGVASGEMVNIILGLISIVFIIVIGLNYKK